MSKYLELCEKLEKTQHILEESKLKFEQIFTKKLSEYLGCEPNLISLEFEKPKIYKKQGVVSRDFSLQITLKTPKYSETKILAPLTFTFAEKEFVEEEDKNHIFAAGRYGNYFNLDKEINNLFDIILEDFQRELI